MVAALIKDPESGAPHQSLGEEIANSVSHGVGLLVALAGIPFLLHRAARGGDAVFIAANSIFAATIVILYLTSTLYHALPRGKAKHVFRIIEHIAIFFLIAGTYTPFTLGVLRGAWGWTLFGLIWSLTLAGVILKLTRGVRHPIISTSLYLLMGWVVLIAARPLWLHKPHMGFFVDLSGRPRLFAGRRLLRARRPPALQPFRLAFVRDRRNRCLHYFAVFLVRGQARLSILTHD